MRICPKCGAEIEGSEKFCPRCGVRLVSEEKDVPSPITKDDVKKESPLVTNARVEENGSTVKASRKAPAGINLPGYAIVLVIIAAICATVSMYYSFIDEGTPIIDLVGSVCELIVWIMAIQDLENKGNLAEGLKGVVYASMAVMLVGNLLSIVEHYALFSLDVVDLLIVVCELVLMIVWIVKARKNYTGAMATYPIVELLVAILFVAIFAVVDDVHVTNHGMRAICFFSILPYYYMYKAIRGE